MIILIHDIKQYILFQTDELLQSILNRLIIKNQRSLMITLPEFVKDDIKSTVKAYNKRYSTLAKMYGRYYISVNEGIPKSDPKYKQGAYTKVIEEVRQLKALPTDEKKQKANEIIDQIRNIAMTTEYIYLRDYQLTYNCRFTQDKFQTLREAEGNYLVSYNELIVTPCAPQRMVTLSLYYQKQFLIIGEGPEQIKEYVSTYVKYYFHEQDGKHLTDVYVLEPKEKFFFDNRHVYCVILRYLPQHDDKINEIIKQLQDYY